MKHAKFTLIEQLTEISNVSKDTLRLRLKRREDFWIIKLETNAPKGLNQELNNVWSPMTTFSVHSILNYCSEEGSDAIMTYLQIYDVKLKFSVTIYVFQMRINSLENGHGRN